MISGKLRKQIFILAAIGLATPMISLAAAPSQIDDTSVNVSYADLNIEAEAGAKVLYARLKRASEQVCSVESHLGWVGARRLLGSLTAVHKAKVCYKDALAAAVAEIDSDTLTNIHSS
ncbi:MAG: UrcA family protein [Woeseiaceae bacterium]|nr:UrcA family protein [Woeseiaceae bacterium]